MPQSQRSLAKTSPVRHFEWTRTSTGSPFFQRPFTSATCWWRSTSFSYATARNSPYSVGSGASAARWTSVSFSIRYEMRSATETMGRSCSAESFSSSGIRAIVPSSFITSQITPAGLRPASRARSTEPSVWPARTSTPPFRARSGNTCPGRARSSGRASSRTAVRMVCARSFALMPVVTPSRASIETVKAVP